LVIGNKKTSEACVKRLGGFGFIFLLLFQNPLWNVILNQQLRLIRCCCVARVEGDEVCELVVVVILRKPQAELGCAKHVDMFEMLRAALKYGVERY